MTADKSRRANGVNSLREIHGDWTLSAAIRAACLESDGSCVISHVQLDSETRKRLLVIELRANKGRVTGALLLPSGLLNERGVVLQFEESAPGSARQLHAESKGCLVDLDFDEPIIKKLTCSRCLHVIAAAETGEEVNFRIPLNGFASALARARSVAS